MKTGQCYSPKNGHTGWHRTSSSMLQSLANIPWDHFSFYCRPPHSRPEEGNYRSRNRTVPVPMGGLRVGAFRLAFPVCREPSSSPALCKENHAGWKDRVHSKRIPRATLGGVRRAEMQEAGVRQMEDTTVFTTRVPMHIPSSLTTREECSVRLLLG